MLLAKKVAPPPRGLIIIVDKCSRAVGVGSSCETWPVHSFVLAFTVVQLRDVFTVLCRHNAQPTALSTSPDPAPPPIHWALTVVHTSAADARGQPGTISFTGNFPLRLMCNFLQKKFWASQLFWNTVCRFQEFGSILKKSKFVFFKNVCLAQNLFIPCTVAVGVYFLCVMCSAH